jgi:acetolactate synthase regulatory subunit
MRHILSILVENEAGALSRVAGLFSARGYNIETLTVAPTEDASLSRMTIVTAGSDEIVEQITKQLNKLVDVVPRTSSAGASWTSPTRPTPSSSPAPPRSSTPSWTRSTEARSSRRSAPAYPASDAASGS